MLDCRAAMSAPPLSSAAVAGLWAAGKAVRAGGAAAEAAPRRQRRLGHLRAHAISS
eukprot:gene4050-22284_t